MADGLVSADSRRVPGAAALLGGAGLLPPLLAILADSAIDRVHPWLLLAALAYAAIILSFLGGMWWGLAAARLASRAIAPWLVLAVLPALIAWPALFVAVGRPLLGGALIGLALVATLLGDRRLVAARLAPPWWMRLRVPLSCGLALLAIVAGWLAQQ